MAAAPASRASASEPLVIFTPSGRRGRVDAGTTVLDAARSPRRRHRLGLRRARHLRPLPGHAGRGLVSEARHHVVGRRTWRPPAPSSATTRAQRPARRPPAVVPRARDGRRSSSTYRPRARSTARSFARRSTLRTSTIDPVVRLHYVEVEPPVLASPSGDLARLTSRPSSASGTSTISRRISRSSARLHAALAKGGHRVTVAVHDGRQHDRGLARLPRSGVRRRDRRGVHDDRRAPRRTCTMAPCSRPTA